MESHPASCPVALFLLLLTAVCVCGASAPDLTRWKVGNGSWTTAANWTAGLPDITREADIGGLANVVIPRGNFAAARLRVGTQTGDRTTVEVNGGHLLVRQDSLIIGEYSGGVARFLLNDGSVEDAMDIFVGGATGSTGRRNQSSLVVNGGRLLGLTLTVGEGLGSDSTVEVNGSRATAICALEFIELLATPTQTENPQPRPWPLRSMPTE